MESDTIIVSSPLATGGVGVTFELDVTAAFLTYLLVKGIPPFLKDCQIETIHLQAGHLGWRTDDLLVVGRHVDGSKRKAAIQIKHSFRLAEKDPDCVKTFTNAWQDFNDASRFIQGQDVLALITSSVSGELQKGLRILLDSARASMSGEDHLRRLKCPNYLDKRAHKYAETIWNIINNAADEQISYSEVWKFLRVLDFCCLDLNNSASNTKALLLTLLAATTSASDGATVASESWRMLVEVARENAGRAGSITWDRLPAELRDRHRRVPDSCTASLRRLQEHSACVIEGARTEIGGVHIPRATLLNELLSLLENHQIVLVVGEAGSGKSALARKAYEILCLNGFGMAFRAESFAKAHIDDVFEPIKLNLAQIEAHCALHARKIAWIESLERLLEKTPRDAFQDFLRAMKKDSSWRLIITCRNYLISAIDILFENDEVTYQRLYVPKLTDVELEPVVTAFPALQRPLSNNRLKELLRIPFILDKAVRMKWSVDVPLPKDEREFRVKVWREVICCEQEPADGMPQLRDEIFTEIALRRARALKPYVESTGLKSAVVLRLQRDSLVISPNDNKALLTVAHDVLEDWALLRWLTRIFSEFSSNPRDFFVKIGTYPAIRGGYRKWFTEMLDCEPIRAEPFARAVLTDENIPAHWQDDTVIGVLLASNVSDFLQRNKSFFLADAASRLRHILRLLRVACQSVQTKARMPMGELLFLFIPEGSGWEATADLVCCALNNFDNDAFPLVLGFMEDWSNQCLYVDYPLGSRQIAQIALHFLGRFDPEDRRHSGDSQKRLLRLLLRIPRFAEAELMQMITAALTNKQRSFREDKLLELLLFNSLSNYTIYRDFPDWVINVVEDVFGLNSARSMPFDLYSGSTDEIEKAFGLPVNPSKDFFVPSAYWGPFWWLLSKHPDKGLNLILHLLNFAVEAYANPTNTTQNMELPTRVKLRLPDGTEHTQWGNLRLWEAYRGTSVTPCAFQSALMALEKWLLERATASDPELPEVLTNLLRYSNNVAITAVIASVATAHCEIAGKAAISLLTNRAFFVWDFDRGVEDSVMDLAIPQRWQTCGPEELACNWERHESAMLSHREYDLRRLACKLQTTELREEVWQIIDAYKTELLPEQNQTEEDKLWQLLLHGMDIRNLAVSGLDNDRRTIKISEPAADIQAVFERHQSSSKAHIVFRRDTSGPADPRSLWAENFAKVQACSAEESDFGGDIEEKLDEHTREVSSSGLCFGENIEGKLDKMESQYVALVWIRDHWKKLNEDQRTWCINRACEAIKMSNFTDTASLAAFIFPALFGKESTSVRRELLIEVLAIALTHPNEEIVGGAAQGVGTFLWDADRNLALTCISALAQQAKEYETFVRKQRTHHQFDLPSEEYFRNQLKEDTRSRIMSRASFCNQTLFEFNLVEWPSWTVLPLLKMLTPCPKEPLAYLFLSSLVQRLPGIWTLAKKQGHRITQCYQSKDKFVDLYQNSFALNKSLASFTLRLPTEAAIAFVEPILGAIPHHPKEVAEFFEWLIIMEGVHLGGGVFWEIWQTTIDRFQASDLPTSLATEHAEAGELLKKLFLNTHWVDETYNWEPLHRNAHRIQKFFESLPPSHIVLSAYAHFLYTVGTVTLPQPLVAIATKLEGHKPSLLLSSEIILPLERILSRLVYSSPTNILACEAVHTAVLFLLDKLVEQGSSAAYKLRDDFITPQE